MHSTVYIISVSAKGEIGRKRSTEWLLMEHLHLSSPLGGGNDGDDDGIMMVVVIMMMIVMMVVVMMVLMVTARSTLWLLMENLSSPKPLMMKLQTRELLWISGGFSSVTPQLPLLSQTVQLPKHKRGFETVHSCLVFTIAQNNQGPFGAKII